MGVMQAETITNYQFYSTPFWSATYLSDRIPSPALASLVWTGLQSYRTFGPHEQQKTIAKVKKRLFLISIDQKR
jgi:hypothetical protein